MTDLLESDEPIGKKLFDDDPHIIPLPPPHQETGELVFRMILERGKPHQTSDGSMYTPLGVVMTNQLAKSGYVVAHMKDGYLIISLVRSDAE